jgi:hypothetical protein
MKGFSVEMGRQKASPMPRRGVQTIASDRQFLHVANPGQQLTHSLPVLQHSGAVVMAGFSTEVGRQMLSPNVCVCVCMCVCVEGGGGGGGVAV